MTFSIRKGNGKWWLHGRHEDRIFTIGAGPYFIMWLLRDV